MAEVLKKTVIKDNDGTVVGEVKQMQDGENRYIAVVKHKDKYIKDDLAFNISDWLFDTNYKLEVDTIKQEIKSREAKRKWDEAWNNFKKSLRLK